MIACIKNSSIHPKKYIFRITNSTKISTESIHPKNDLFHFPDFNHFIRKLFAFESNENCTYSP